MFKGIQDIIRHKIGGKDDPHNHNGFLPIETAKTILEAPDRKKVLARLQTLLGLPLERYEALCEPLIHRFAEFVQSLPETQNSYFAQHGGLLDHMLQRVLIALEIVQKHFLLEGKAESGLTEEQTLWTYTLFTAALFHNIGTVSANITTQIYDRNRRFVQEWQPLDGPMISQGHYYKYDFTLPAGEHFKQHTSALLARQLMPLDGFRWISSDKELFAIWLSLLHGDMQGGGVLGPILLRANALAIHQYFIHLVDLKAQDDASRRTRFMLTLAPARIDDATRQLLLGLEFLDWVNLGIESNHITIDKDNIYQTEDGLLITDDAFKDFVKQSEMKNITWQGVQASFIKMNLHVAGNYGVALRGYMNISDNKRFEGLVMPLDHITSQITAETLRHSARAQNNFVQLPGKVTLQTTGKLQNPAQYKIGPNGQLVQPQQKQSKVTPKPNPLQGH